MNTIALSAPTPESAAERFQQLGRDLMQYIVVGEAKSNWLAPPKPDKDFQASCEALEKAWLSGVKSLHANLLDQRLNNLVSKAEEVLTEHDATLRLRFYKELDIRRKVKPDFLFTESISSNFSVNDSYKKSILNSLPIGLVGGGTALVLSKGLPVFFIVGVLVTIGVQKWKYPQEKARIRRQLVGEVSRLMTQAAQQSEALLHQAEKRFNEVFEEFLAA